MNLPKAAVGAVTVLAAAALFIPMAGAQSPVDTALSAPVFSNSVFAGSYVSSGATSTINGDVLSGLYLTTGAGATINGNTAAVAATTLGAGANIFGNVQSGAAITIGAAGAVSGTQSSTRPSIGAANGELSKAQSTLNSLSGTSLAPGDIATNMSFSPGVYKVSGLKTVTAGVTITLDANNEDNAVFIFNISNYLAFGANVDVVVVNGNSNTRVIWNAGNYITVGAGAEIVGTIIANGYVSTGAFSVVSSADNDTCGGAVYSASSYVSVGAGARVGNGIACSGPEPPSECDFSRLTIVEREIKDYDDHGKPQYQRFVKFEFGCDEAVEYELQILCYTDESNSLYVLPSKNTYIHCGLGKTQLYEYFWRVKGTSTWITAGKIGSNEDGWLYQE